MIVRIEMIIGIDFRVCSFIFASIWPSSLAIAQSVSYELVKGSELGYCQIDPNGNLECTTADIRGTFTVDFLQNLIRVEGSVRDVAFQSISGPEYAISGGGLYLIAPSANSPFGLPAKGAMELGLKINDVVVGFTTELTRFQTFPRIDAGLIQSNFPPHGYGIRIVAQPMGDEASRFFRRADVNGDTRRNLTDAVAILDRLFKGGAALGCEDAADANDDGKIDLSDCIVVLTYLFGGADGLPIPSVLCGLDPTDDGLECNGQPVCLLE